MPGPAIRLWEHRVQTSSHTLSADSPAAHACPNHTSIGQMSSSGMCMPDAVILACSTAQPSLTGTFAKQYIKAGTRRHQRHWRPSDRLKHAHACFSAQRTPVTIRAAGISSCLLFFFFFPQRAQPRAWVVACRTANCAPSWSEMPSRTASKLASGATMKLCQVPFPSALSQLFAV